MILNYRMNAGHVPLDSWLHGPEGGGRNLGEACHIYDLFVFLTGSRAIDVAARAIRPQTAYYSPHDNFVATIAFEDGSVATLTYTALGSRAFPKETLDVFVDGKVLSLHDYRGTTIHGVRVNGRAGKQVDKGHREELVAFAHVIQHGGDWPIPLEQQAEATRIALDVEKSLKATVIENSEPLTPKHFPAGVALRRAS